MLRSILTFTIQCYILPSKLKNMPRAVSIVDKDTILTVGHLINKLKEFNKDLPVKLINWDNDPTLESRDIGDVFFFERMDTQDGYKDNHIVISYTKDGSKCP